MTELEKVLFDMKLKVVVLGVSDVDRAKAFYENLGWRLDNCLQYCGRHNPHAHNVPKTKVKRLKLVEITEVRNKDFRAEDRD